MNKSYKIDGMTFSACKNQKASIAKLTNIIAIYFLPTVIVLAILAAILWKIAGESLISCLTIFISVLIIACPYTLEFAVTTSIMVGKKKGFEKGILIKDEKAFENISKINTVVFDKTGTITEGNPKVTNIVTYGTFSQKELLIVAASAEKGYEHPLGKAIIALAEEKSFNLREIEKFNALSDLGISAIIDGKDVLLGNKKLMTENSIDLGGFLEQADNLAIKGKTPIYVSINNELKGIIAVADTIKPTSKTAVNALHNMGITVAMITGDNKNTADAIAKQIGIDMVLSEILPENKANQVAKLQGENKTVAMVINDINNVPALAQADIGIAIGTETNTAIENADIVLIHDDLNDIVTAIRLSHYTMRNIKQNLYWTLTYNILSIPIAMGLLHVFGGPLLTPIIATIAMSLNSILVLSNALRLKKIK